MTNNIYIYHHNDADGIAAAAMVDLAYPNATKKFISSGYPFIVDETPFQFMTNPEDLTVFIVDLSLNYDALTRLLTGEMIKVVNKVIWIDHHETSVEAMTRNHIPYPKNFQTCVDRRRCGAFLTYEFLHPEGTVPKFLRVIDTYDRHDGSSGDIRVATDLNLALLSVDNLSPTSDIWRTLLAGEDLALQTQQAFGSIVHKYLDAENENFIRKCAVVTKIRGLTCLAVNAKGTSILFDSVPYEKYPLRMAWYHDGKQYRYSLYSDESINCASLASIHGGGGHPGAAGFSSEQLLFLDQNCEEYSPN